MDARIIILILNGLTQAALFFLLGSGLTLAFGLMRIINLSHGAFYLLGGYIGYTVMKATGNWGLALLAGALSITILGFLFERTLLARVRGQDLPETLLTVALSMVIADFCLAIWGGHSLALNVPKALNPSITVFGITYPGFRYLLMLASVVVAVGLWLLLYKTKLGAAVRAGVDDRETASALGVNIDVMYTIVFLISAFLVGVAGVLGGTYLQLSPGSDTTILTYALVVIILGGQGSLLGAVVGALILGQIASFGSAYAAEYWMFLVFAPLAIVLAIRPQGLFGRTV
ncbi:MAG: branched-chain amino acid ABC transporter permease [Anaerolineae bacterium]|nr:branched-chain amino acid ABC transporter permease [Anaerolineae bacterium]